MIQHNPPHPGTFIKQVYLDVFNIRLTEMALNLKVAPSTVSRLINKRTSVTPTMALKLSRVLGRSPESWLRMQRNYDLWNLTLKFKSDIYEPKI